MKHNKYRQYPVVEKFNREWPNNTITKAPVYCSVDLRDGNQALVNPLGIEQKVEYFKVLADMGFKHIEVSYPSASDTDFNFTRKLIEEDMVPDDVYIQVLIPARAELIDKSVEAMRGVKKGIFHLYNPTAEFQRKVVFKKSDDEIIAMAVESMKRLMEKTKDFEGEVVYEYTPESFSQTDLEFAVKICNEVINVVEPTPQKKLIINLPNTLEACMPNIYADRVEWMCKNFINRESLIVSVHPHNDRGTSVASAEMAVLAGADRVEGTLFGNGERAGNLDLVNFAFNIYSQCIDPKLNLEHIDEVKEFFENITEIKTHIRHPYVGDMIFTAFSGGHQDAIKKGFDFYDKTDKQQWNVPYLPIDPKDIKRDYDKVVRINSQSGKGGADFIIAQFFGEKMSKDEAKKFGKTVKEASDKKGVELSKDEIIDLYKVFKGKEEKTVKYQWDPKEYEKHSTGQQIWARELIDKLGLKGDEHILDIGCGDGKVTAEIASYLKEGFVKGVDSSCDMIQLSKAKFPKEKYPNISFEQRDARDLTFEDEFDIVFSNAALHWIKDHRPVIKGVYRSLKKGGRILLQMGGEGNAKGILSLLDQLMVDAEYKEYFKDFDFPYGFLGIDEYKKLLEENNFTVKRVELIPKDMVHKDIEALKGWIRTTWLPYTSRIPKEKREKFIRTVCDAYIKKVPLDREGRVHLDMVRLEVEAYK